MTTSKNVRDLKNILHRWIFMKILWHLRIALKLLDFNLQLNPSSQKWLTHEKVHRPPSGRSPSISLFIILFWNNNTDTSDLPKMSYTSHVKNQNMPNLFGSTFTEFALTTPKRFQFRIPVSHSRLLIPKRFLLVIPTWFQFNDSWFWIPVFPTRIPRP